MVFVKPNESSSKPPDDALKKAREHILLIIDSNETRAQKLARLLTLAGLRAIVTSSIYQAFDRFLKEGFAPRAVLIGPQEETTGHLFSRFFQRLIQDLQYEPPVIALSSFPVNDGLLLTAEEFVSSTTHTLSQQNSLLLKRIWQVLPSAQIPLKITEKAMILTSLSEAGFLPRVTHNKRSFSSHLYYQLKAAKKIIPPEQWDIVLTDVGLAQFCKEENWPSSVDQFTIPPEYFSLLTRAVMFSNPQQPIQQVYDWANHVESDALQKAVLIFLMQQIPKIIGVDRTMRTLLNILTNEVDSRRGEKLTEWKRMKNGSFIFVFYSNIFMYSVMGGEQTLCSMWQAAFDLMLRLAKQQQHWSVQEIECSAQTHTGHCVFQLSPKKKKKVTLADLSE